MLSFLRFALDVQLCGDWAHLGGFADRLNFLGVILHVAIVDSPDVAEICDALVAAKISRRARGLVMGVGRRQLLCFESDLVRAKTGKEHTESADAEKKSKGAEKKGERHPPRDKDRDADARSLIR